MGSIENVSSNDILRPPTLAINGINYRRNIFIKCTNSDEKSYRMNDLEESCDMYEDEQCDERDFRVEEFHGGFKATLNISAILHRFIVGHKGETRRRIEVETGAKVVLPPKGQDGCVVITSREKNSVLSACTRISLIVESEKKKLPFTHFMSFSVVSEEILSSFDKFKNQVLKTYKSDGIDESIFQNSKKLHLTIGVMVAIDERDVEKIKEILNECKNNLNNKGLFKTPLNVRMEGLEYMNDDPGCVDVLYAKVHLDDGSDRLQVVADEFVEACVSYGLMMKQFDKVKLHVTIMNTLFRKDGNSEGFSKRKRKETFDAKQVLKDLKDYYFGTVQLKGLQLSKLHSVNSEGYYESDCCIEF